MRRRRRRRLSRRRKPRPPRRRIRGSDVALSGMTGFAREDAALESWSWAVEARSVNGRNMEARFRGPPGFDSLERVAREGCQARFARGQVTIGLQAKRSETAAQ